MKYLKLVTECSVEMRNAHKIIRLRLQWHISRIAYGLKLVKFRLFCFTFWDSQAVWKFSNYFVKTKSRNWIFIYDKGSRSVTNCVTSIWWPKCLYPIYLDAYATRYVDQSSSRLIVRTPSYNILFNIHWHRHTQSYVSFILHGYT